MAKSGSTVILEADPDDPEDFDVTQEALDYALAERRKRLRGPQRAPTKELVSIRFDPDLLAHFRAGGRGWQGRMNEALRKATGL